MKKKKILVVLLALLLVLPLAFLGAYRFIGVGGKILKIAADPDSGFYTEYYLLIPDTLRRTERTFLLVEMNNTGGVSDEHETHVESAYDTVRFGQANRIARELGTPLLVPCFDRPESDWQMYTHALDRDALLCTTGPLARIDRQLNGMVENAALVLADQDITLQHKILLNGFSASGTFANRFAALYPEKVAAVAAGGINGMVILPVPELQPRSFTYPGGDLQSRTLIYPMGIADMEEIADVHFDLLAFAALPQYYYMGALDENDTLPFGDAFSDEERQIIVDVLGEQMAKRWEICEGVYQVLGIRAEFHTVAGTGHETTRETVAAVVAFFAGIIGEYR